MGSREPFLLARLLRSVESRKKKDKDTCDENPHWLGSHRHAERQGKKEHQEKGACAFSLDEPRCFVIFFASKKKGPTKKGLLACPFCILDRQWPPPQTLFRLLWRCRLPLFFSVSSFFCAHTTTHIVAPHRCLPFVSFFFVYNVLSLREYP
nr:hypothetical protein [Pandoravirus aubagnensis]